MKPTHTARLLVLTVLAVFSQSCKNFLDKEPLGSITEGNLFNDQTNAIQAINGVYDAAAWDQGPKFGTGNYLSQTYEWMFGDYMSDDSEKGSTPSDNPSNMTDLKAWTATPGNGAITTRWVHNFTAIARANTVIANVDNGTIPDDLKKRIKGEALFLRGYLYFTLVETFGGMPLFSQPILPTEAANAKRSSIAETYAFIENDLKMAATLLPEKSAYATADLGRATKGAANGFLARAIMYQLGTVNGNKHTWQDVYDLTGTIIDSKQYGLLPNYAMIHQTPGENASESVFEFQYSTSNSDYGPISVGTTSNVFQNNRKTFGYGFNNPTQDLVNAFEPNDPRLLVTVIKNNDVVLGILNIIDRSENDTGYLNRKAAILKPDVQGAGPQNVRRIRYADILLIRAEAAAQLGKSGEAVGLVNQVRQRARVSTKPPGTVVGTLSYDPTNAPAGTLPDLDAGLAGQPLLTAIWHERRVELGMEALRYFDLIRTGRYLGVLPAAVRARAQTHLATETSVNPFPLLPIELNDAQTWHLPQNPGY